MKTYKLLFLFFLSLFLISQNTFAQTGIINNENKAQGDIFSENNQNNSGSLNKILKPRFQFQILNKDRKLIETSKEIQIWFLDSKRERFGFCTIDKTNGLCELDLRNKSVNGTKGFIGVLIDSKSIDKLVPFDFELEKNSQLEIGSGNVVHGFANLEIILKRGTNSGTGYDFESMRAIPIGGDETSNERIDTGEGTYNQEEITGKISEGMGPGKVTIEDWKGNEIVEPFYIQLDKDGNYNSSFKLVLRKNNFELGKNYSLIFYSSTKGVMNSGKTVKFSTTYQDFKDKLNGTVLTFNKKYSTTIEAKTPFFKIGFLILFCGAIVFIMDKYFIKSMNYLRGDKTQIGRITNKKSPFNF